MNEHERLTERIRSAYPTFRPDQVGEYAGGFQRMIADFGVARADLAVTRVIDNEPSNFVPTIGTVRTYVPAMDERRKFQACEKDGCADGWRPGGKNKAGDAYVIRCQCFLDWAAKAA